MSPRTFVKLAIAAAVTALAAIGVFAASAPWSEVRQSGAKLVPSLTAAAGVGSIAIQQGDKTLTLVAGPDKRWTIKERDGFAADPEPIRALLVKLAEAERIDAKTHSPDRHGVLEVEAPNSKDARSKGLHVIDAKGVVLTDLVIGKRKFEAFGAGKAGTYVRNGNDAQVWLVNSDIDVAADVRRWIKTSVFETDGAKLAAVTVAVDGEPPLEISRVDGKLAFKDLPGAGKKLKDAGAAESLARAAAQIDADDVRKLAQTPAGAGVGVVTLKGDKGLEVVLRVRRDGDAAWVSVTASGDGDAKMTADAITARAAGWEFKIPTSKADAILKRRADLIE